MSKYFNSNIFYIFCILTNYLFAGIIDHQPQNEVSPDSPLDIEVFTDYSDNSVVNASLYYKTDDQIVYLQEDLHKSSENYYSVTLPKELLVGDFLVYYILFELSNNEFISYPEVNPHNNPVTLRIGKGITSSILVDNAEVSNIIAGSIDYEIIAPKPNQKVLNKNLIISLSYFKVKDVDLNNVEVYIDDIDVTLSANIRESNLFLVPSEIIEGKHEIKVILKNNKNVQYEPIVWSFYSYEDEASLSTFTISGRVWNGYVNNEVDGNISSNNSTNFNFNLSSNILDLKAKFKKSSLENNLFQATDRYYFKFDLSDALNIEYGDFYPTLGSFLLNGNRVRGIGFDANLKHMQIDLIYGELARAVQGNPLDNGLIISDYSVEDDMYNLSLSRNNYTFKRDVSGLRVGFGNRDKLNFGFNILKVKDDIGSVNKNLSSALISIPTSEPFDNLISDQCIDFLDDGCDANDYLLIDNDNDGLFDDAIASIIATNVHSSELSCLDETIVIDDCSDYDNPGPCVNENTYSLYQCHWAIIVEKDKLDDFITDNNYTDLNGNNIEIIELEDQWTGDKPKDNISFGADISFKTKNNNLKFRSSIAMSLINENIWNPIKTLEDFDTFSDDYEDCYYGRTYLEDSNLNNVFEWVDCQAFNSTGTNITNTLTILEEGIYIYDLPNPADFEDLLHYNFDVVPSVPFYSLINKISNNEDVNFEDFLNSPELAYDMDLSMNVSKHQFQFGVKKVGSEFNSLGNPYLQKDMKEHYFVDRIRFLENKMYVMLKVYNIQNGLLDGESGSKTKKYDVNINYYPGIDLPSISLSGGRHFREGGDSAMDWNEFLALCDLSSSGLQEVTLVDNATCYNTWFFLDDTDDVADGTISQDELDYFIDSRINTQTDNYNIGYSQRFKLKHKRNINVNYNHSTKKDLILNQFIDDETYVSPRSLNKNISINFSTYYNSKFDSKVLYSNSSYNFAQSNSEYYQDQKIEQFGIGFNYNSNTTLDKIGAELKYVDAKGTNSYNQIGLKVYSKLIFKEDILLNLTYRFSNKSQSSEKYFNNTIKATLSYKF